MRDRSLAPRRVIFAFYPGLAGLLLVSARLPAQQVTVAPTFGAYIPSENLARAPTGERYKQVVNFSAGGRVSVFFSERLGFEGSLLYSPSHLQFVSDSAETEADASLLTAGGRLMLALLPISSPFSFVLSGGVGLVRRSGQPFDRLPDRTRFGATFGGSARFQIDRRLRLQVNTEDYIYRFRFQAGGISGRRVQHDIHLSVGFGIPL